MKTILRTFLALAVLITLSVPVAPAFSAETSNSHATDLERSSLQRWAVADNAALSYTGSMTYCQWSKFESVPGSGERFTYASKDDDTNGATDRSWNFAQFNNGGTQQLEFFVSANGITITNFGRVDWTPSTATDYFTCAVYDTSSNTVQFYINASAQGTAQTVDDSIADKAGPFVIGAFRVNTTPGNHFDGIVDGALLYSRALSGANISSLYSDPCNPSTTDLVGWWLFNNDGNDSHGTNDLTNQNSATFTTDTAYVCAAAASPFDVYSRAFWW